MQTDPLGYADGLNPYAYVGNDPVNFTDPLGLWTLRLAPTFGYAVGTGERWTSGFFMGTREDGSFTIGGYRSHVSQYGFGVDASFGGAYCLRCSVQDIGGFSISLGGKLLAGLELGAPVDSAGRINFAKTEIGFSAGASAELAGTVGETHKWVWGEDEGRECNDCLDIFNVPEYSIDPELLKYYQYGNYWYFDSSMHSLESYLNQLALSGVPIISNSALYVPRHPMSDVGIIVMPLPPLPLPPSQ